MSRSSRGNSGIAAADKIKSKSLQVYQEKVLIIEPARFVVCVDLESTIVQMFTMNTPH